MAYKIVDNLTQINFTDASRTKIDYIVIHYFGSLGTAKAVSEYFRNAYRGASAHLSLDEGVEVFRSVKDEDIAWHCGTTGTYYHPKCRNSNSIGIEVRPYKLSTKTMYASDTDWYFTSAIIDRLVEVVADLVKKYNVPFENVIRHYDVTHKQCPRPYQGDDMNQYHKKSGNAMWAEFKNRLKTKLGTSGPTTPAPVDQSVINVGDVVDFKGGPVFSSSTATVQASTRPASKVKITSKVNARNGYHAISQDGKGVYGWVQAATLSKVAPKPVDYLVRVTDSALNIRSGPGISYSVNGVIRDKGVYTIVDTQNGWGRLKSGAGWISLVYTTKL